MRLSKLFLFIAMPCAFSAAGPRLYGQADTTAITNALMERLDSESTGKRFALLSAFVTERGPKRTAEKNLLVELPRHPLRNLTRVEPPADAGSATTAQWAKSNRLFERLYSIGGMTVSGSTTSVDVYVEEPFSSGGVNMLGLTRFRYTLVRGSNGWRFVKAEPVVSTTFADQ